MRSLGMRRADVYRCPKCQGAITAEADRLSCSCGAQFPVVGGLPRFVSDEGYAGSFGLQWRTFARAQLDSASGLAISRERLFRGTGWPTSMKGEWILEAGCGMGRFTEVLLSTGAEVLSFDYSAAAEVAAENLADRGAEICQASIFEMPYARASFDRVFCYGVIQHTPDVHLAFQKLVEMVRAGGHLAVDVYDRARLFFNARYRVRWLTKRLPKETVTAWARRIVPLYMKLAPPLHPWNQLLFPWKDYRGLYPGMSRADEIEWSVLDTVDMLTPEYDSPQYARTMRRWAEEAGLVDIAVRRGGNGVELNARKPT